MSSLLTVDFLRGNSLAELCDRFHIKAKRHGLHPNLVHLKYDQIGSPMGEPIVQECRALILDEADDWNVICRSYGKFFNCGEGHAAQIDWSSASVLEKLDGSLLTLYWYLGAWHVCTTGTADASGQVETAGMTFAELFWKTFRSLGYLYPEPSWKRCYIFELMSPYNRIIVPHTRSRLVIHGVRNLGTMQEEAPESVAETCRWECVKSFPITTIEQCIEAAKSLDPMECEGYVVRDANFNRIKVKGPQYVALAHMKESMGPRRMLELVRANESEEFLAYFPEWEPIYRKVRCAYDSLCDHLESEYSRIKDIESQKQFALEATKTRCSSPLFSVRVGRHKSVRDFFSSASIGVLEKACPVEVDFSGNVATKE